jgi:hypothetical protein
MQLISKVASRCPIQRGSRNASKLSRRLSRSPSCRDRWKSARAGWLLHAGPPPHWHAIAAALVFPSPSPSRGRLPLGTSWRIMPDDELKLPVDPDSYQVAEELAARLQAAGCEYALGGAIALGFWAEARGTLDVDVTLYLPLDDPAGCLRLLEQIGCHFDRRRTEETLNFCQVQLLGLRLDVFLPMAAFYEVAKARRREVPVGSRRAYIWDAETLCVFKMMFFRQKDLVDVESILRSQGASLDRAWVETSLLELYGKRDPRISQWRELAAELQE